MPEKIKLATPDRRMLQAMEALKQKGTIRYRQEFCDATGVLKQNLVNIRKGTQYFTVDHIRNACKAYNLNANWILGLSDEMYAHKAKLRPISEGIGLNKKRNTAAKTARKSS